MHFEDAPEAKATAGLDDGPWWKDVTRYQWFVFTVASLALSTLVPMRHLQVVWACAIVFVVARVCFWLGYRLNPLYRARACQPLFT